MRKEKKMKKNNVDKPMCSCTWAFLSKIMFNFSLQFSSHFEEKTFL